VLWKLLNNKFYSKYFVSVNINFHERVESSALDSLVAFEGAQIAIDCICNQNNSKTIFERVNCIISTLEFNDTKQKKLFGLKEIANVYMWTDFFFGGNLFN
jgi:hypothetical protein